MIPFPADRSPMSMRSFVPPAALCSSVSYHVCSRSVPSCPRIVVFCVNVSV
jgi:hypothetical protein